MTVYISGGSNSLKTDGWVPKLSAKIGKGTEIRNISVGGAPSTMGAFRSLSTVSMEPGDTLLWEYAINDELHIDIRGYDAVELVKAVEWLLIGCREANVKFAAMIFRTRRRHLKPTDCSYNKLLAALFCDYNVPFFDVNAEFAKRRPKSNGVKAAHYSDRAHYDTKAGIMNLIVKGATEMLEQASVPHNANSQPTERLVTHDRFNGGECEKFENSAISLKVWNPGTGGLSGTFNERGRVIGLVVMSTSAGGVMDFSLNAETYRLSVSYKERNYDKPMVKFISLPTLTGRTLDFAKGDNFRIIWADSAEGVLADLKFNANPGPQSMSAREARVAAVLVESSITSDV